MPKNQIIQSEPASKVVPTKVSKSTEKKTRKKTSSKQNGRRSRQNSTPTIKQLKKYKFNIEVFEIDLKTPGKRDKEKQTCKALIVQLCIEKKHWMKNDESLPNISSDAAESRVNNVFDILEAHDINLVVFPELSIPETILNKVVTESRKYKKTVFVMGTHYSLNENNQRISVAPVVFNGRVFLDRIQKITPTSEEKNAGVVPGKSLAYFKNTPAGNFAVLICADMLNKSVNHIFESLELKLDVLCVLACQKTSPHRHHLESEAYCMHSRHGTCVLYANVFCCEISDGKSAFFAHEHNSKDRKTQQVMLNTSVDDPKTSPRYIIAEYSPPMLKPAIDTTPTDQRNEYCEETNTKGRIEYNGSSCKNETSSHRCLREGKKCHVRRNKIKLVAFDLDDTLIYHPNHHYSWANVFSYLGFSQDYREQIKKSVLPKMLNPVAHDSFCMVYQKWCDDILEYWKDRANAPIDRNLFNKIASEYHFCPGTNELLNILFDRKDTRMIIVSGGIDAIGANVLSEYWGKFYKTYINNFSFSAEGKLLGVTATKYDFQYKVMLCGKSVPNWILTCKERLHTLGMEETIRGH